MIEPASHVFETMGTVVSIRARGALEPATTSAIQAAFARWNDRFSLFSPTSELSKVASGQLALTDASVDLRDAYAQAIEWRASTGGAFTAHRPDGTIDLNGIVKALAIAEAGTILDAAASSDWMVNCGGDVFVRGQWTLGIANPADSSRLLASVNLAPPHRALATSGTAERGDHIWGAATDFEQVTVVAHDIVTADVLATAIIAGGRATLDTATRTWPIEALAVGRAPAGPEQTSGPEQTAGSELIATPGFRALLAKP